MESSLSITAHFRDHHDHLHRIREHCNYTAFTSRPYNHPYSFPNLQDGITPPAVCHIHLIVLTQPCCRLVRHGHHAEALAVISAMEDKPISDAHVQRTYYGILEAVAVEFPGTSGGDKASLRELLTGGRSQNFRRTVIAVVCQMFQQLTGINLIT
jgi:hypothetical protein